MSIKVTLRGAIESLQYERHRLSEALADYPYGQVAPRIDALNAIIGQLVIVECELEDAMGLHEQAPAQHGELRDAPPAASEESGDISFADFQKIAERMTSERRLMRMKEALNSSDQQTEKSALGYSSGNDQGDGLEALPGGVEESRDQIVTFTDAEEFPQDAVIHMGKPPVTAEDFTLLDPAVLRDEPEIPEGFTKWEGGECPVAPSSALIQFYDRNGGPFIERAYDVEWGHSGVSRDVQIIAYRIITPEAEPGTEGYAPVVDAEPSPIDAAVEKGAITQDEADLLAAAKAELEGSTARMFAQGMMADADRHQSDQRSIVEKIGGLFKREREDA